MPAPGLPADFREALARESGHAWAAADVVFFDETSSTNDVALELASAGARDGTAVVALAQTAGRGRRGRSWTSPSGAGVYFSVIVRPPSGGSAIDPAATSRITLLAAVAAAEAVERVSGVVPQIKWPNDLVVDRGRDAEGAWLRRKLAGILTEASVSGGRIQHIVVGIGINLRPTNYPPDVAATSLESESGRDPGAAAVFAACRAGLASEYARWLAGGWENIAHRWRRRSPSSQGFRVRWADASRTIEGVSAGLDDEGALRIADAEGRVHRILSGEVLWA
jgi:BirA family biotin operon repressor/biotin-[acetyl-CoA-carboxylase] ligase